MTYATKENMVDQFGEQELIMLTKADEAIDDDVLNRVLLDADALINGYLASKYSLPLSTVPEMLTLIASDIAYYRLQAEGASETSQKRYNDAIKMLRDIADGKIKVPSVAGLEPADTSNEAVMEAIPDRLFSSESLKGY